MESCVSIIVGGLILALFFGAGAYMSALNLDPRGRVIFAVNTITAAGALGYAVYGIVCLII